MVTKECSWPVVPRRGSITRPLAWPPSPPPPLLLSLPLGGTVLLSGGVPLGGSALLTLLPPRGPEIVPRRVGTADNDDVAAAADAAAAADEVAEYPGLWAGFRFDLGTLFAEPAWTLSIAWRAVPTLPCWLVYIACARLAGAAAALLSLAPLTLLGIMSLLPFAPTPMVPALPPPPLLPLAEAE